MSHHFDTKTAREDPRLNLCDLYLFAGSGVGTTVMAMTVNPAPNASSVAPFHEEAVYAFRFDTDGDRYEDVSFKVRFGGTARGGSTPENRFSAMPFDVRRAEHTPDGLNGELVASGHTDQVIAGEDGIRAFAGVVGDAFAGDAAPLKTFTDAFAQGRYEPQVFGNQVDFFHDRTVAAIVLEVPNRLIANATRVHAWATVSLYGHAPEQQVARWGLPLFTHLFLGDEDLRERFNRTRPCDGDLAFKLSIASIVSSYAALAGTTADPREYGQRVATLFGPLTLPYELGSVASFDYTGFNGRSLHDNVMDNMLSLLTNSPLGTGIKPDPRRLTHTFPYLSPTTNSP